MKTLRSILVILAFIVLWVLLLGGAGFFPPALGQNPQRVKTVELKVTQYIWELVDKATFKVYCEVIIDREGPPTPRDAINICPAKILPATATPPPGPVDETPTPLPFNQDLFFQNTAWRFKTKRETTRTVKIQLPEIVLNVTVPQGPLASAYVTLSAYEPIQGYKITQIQGQINQVDFSCDSDQCDLLITEGSQITFRAYSSYGDKSVDLQTSIQIVSQQNGIYLTQTSLSPFTIFEDACADTWGIKQYQFPKWAEFPQLPEKLNTAKTLHFLAARLIQTKIVNASDCPGGGLINAVTPNGCGVERAKSEMVNWQNQYDPMIWSISRKVGIPAKIIKVLIEKESQFWPGNALNFIQEFGLAQINQMGADVVLRWDQELFNQACSETLDDCTKPYAGLPDWQQAMLRGALIRLMNAECPGCVNGVDQTTSNQSIDVIGRMLKANCSQVNFILNDTQAEASYEDLWKFTIFSYHSGYWCVNDAITEASKNQAKLDWPTVSSYIRCPGAADYVNDVWDKLVNFESYAKLPAAPDRPIRLPTIIPSRTPQPSPTPIISHNTIRVFVYLEIADKKFPDNILWVNGIISQLTFADGTSYSKTVVDGQVIFDTKSMPVGSEVIVSLPGLYRSFTTYLTEQGEILVPFKLLQPPMPPTLP